MDSPKILVILGPTSTGKSALAIKLALRLGASTELSRMSSGQAKKQYGIKGAEIISADSRQVYKELDIGTGKITKKEMAGIPHHLLDVANPKRIFTVVQYQKLAKQALKKILKKGKLPIICGGTGLYIDALLYSYKFPPVPPDPRLRKKLEQKSAEELFAILQEYDSNRAATIDPKNKRRLVRALEIILKTKAPIPSSPQKSYSNVLENIGITIKYQVLKIGLNFPQEELETKIKKRLEDRLRKGLVAEVKKLKKELSAKRLDNFGLEYRYVNRYLDGLLTYDEMKKKLLTEIWHYAKRQMTWFKRDKQIYWIKNPREAERLVKNFLI